MAEEGREKSTRAEKGDGTMTREGRCTVGRNGRGLETSRVISTSRLQGDDRS